MYIHFCLFTIALNWADAQDDSPILRSAAAPPMAMPEASLNDPSPNNATNNTNEGNDEDGEREGKQSGGGRGGYDRRGGDRRDRRRGGKYGGDDKGRPQNQDRPMPTEPPFEAYVSHVNIDATEDDLYQVFKDKCDVEDIVFQKAGGPNWRGAVVKFKDLESLKEALTLSGSNLKGRSITVLVERKRENRDNDGQRHGGRDRDRGDRRGGRDGEDRRGGHGHGHGRGGNASGRGGLGTGLGAFRRNEDIIVSSGDSTNRPRFIKSANTNPDAEAKNAGDQQHQKKPDPYGGVRSREEVLREREEQKKKEQVDKTSTDQDNAKTEGGSGNIQGGRGQDSFGGKSYGRGGKGGAGRSQNWGRGNANNNNNTNTRNHPETTKEGEKDTPKSATSGPSSGTKPPVANNNKFAAIFNTEDD